MKVKELALRLFELVEEGKGDWPIFDQDGNPIISTTQEDDDCGCCTPEERRRIFIEAEF